MTEKQLRVNDFFCGAGGMGLGFKYAGFRLAGAWDFDKWAVESYGHNVSPKVKQMDISQMTAADVPYADVWTFGFPCQDISVAGKGAGMVKGQTRSGLFYEVMRLLDETSDKPKIILAENVKAVKKYMPEIEKEYAEQGYKMFYALYNSKYWGVPQNRERYFILGVHESVGKDFEFPEQQTEFVPKLSSILEENVDEKYYIDDLKAAKIIEQAVEGLRVRQATKKGYDIAIEGDSINISHPNSKTRRGRVGKQVAQTLLTGTEQLVVLKDVHACITPDRVDKRQNGRRDKGNEEEMFTLTAQDRHGVIEVVGMLDIKGQDNIRRVYNPEGISPTLTTSEGGNRQPKVLVNDVNKIGHIEEWGQKGGVFSTDGISPTVIATDFKTLKLICEGNVNPSGKGMNGQVYNIEGISPTLTTNKGEGIKVTDCFRVRKLTPREYARLQGFPESFEFVVSNSQLYKQFGNAVTVNISQVIAERIKEFLD